LFEGIVKVLLIVAIGLTIIGFVLAICAVLTAIAAATRRAFGSFYLLYR
jgi:hypothetical protein